MSKDDKQWYARAQYMKAIGTVYSVTLGFFVVLSMMFVTLIGQVKTPNKAEAATCSLPASVSTTIELTPDSADNIIDCSGQDITVTSTGKLVIKSYKTSDSSSTNDGGVVLKVANLTIETGGEVSADGQGYIPLETDGGSALASVGVAGGSGGGNGGSGGSGNTSGGVGNTVGETGGTIGNKDYPVTLGGAGGSAGGGGAGGIGGGAIKIESSGTVTIDGKITANGTSGAKSVDNQTSGGGGAGGSIWVEAQILAGAGQVTAQGGGTDNTASYFGGGGGGGRVALICTSSTTFPSGNVSVAFGIGSQNGQIGTLVGPGCKPPEPTVLKFYEKNATAGYVDRELSVSDFTAKTALTFASDLVGTNLKLEIEIREKAQAFTNTATNAQVSAASNKACSGMSGMGMRISDYCGFVEVTTGLSASKEYKWQARIVNDFGRVSNWVQFGGNASSERDFTIVGPATEIIILEGNNQSATVGQAVAVKPKVRVVDAAGNGIPFYEFTAWTVLTGGGSLSNSLLTADASGVVTTDWTLGTVGGVANNTMSIANTSAGLSATFTASAVPGAIESYIVTEGTVLSLVNTAFSFTVVAKDSYGNTVPFSDNLTIAPVSSNDVNAPGLGTLTPDSYTIQPTSDPITISNATYSYEESIKIKVYDANGKVGYSRAILFVNAIGSCPAITIDTNQTWNAADVPGGVFDCRGLGTLTVENGITFTLQSYSNGDSTISNDYGVTILADGFNVKTGGVMTGTGTGYAPTVIAASGEHGGYTSTGAGTPYGSVYEPATLGTGGNATGWSTYPGSGGGAIKLSTTGTTTINGTVTVNGTSMTGYGSTNGGAGGSIWIDTATIAGLGTVSASGGNGTVSSGSGGRIAVYYNTNTNFNLDGEHIQAYGGWHYGYYNTWETVGWGGAGTTYVEQKGVDSEHGGILIVDNNGHNGSYAVMPEASYKFTKIEAKRYGHVEFVGQSSILEISSGAGMEGDDTKPQIKISGTFNYTGVDRLMIDGVDLVNNGKIIGVNDVTVGQTLASGLTLYGHTWYFSDTVPYQFGDMLVTSHGTVSLVSAGNHGVYLEVDGLTVEAGGWVSGNGTGYSAYADADSVYEPEALGQGGTGGSIKLTVAGTLALNGSLTSDGACNSSRGGKIWINTATLSGTGSISASGSCSPWNSFNGTGGRIAVYYNTNTNFSLDGDHLKAYGGRWQGRWDPNATDGWGNPGTVYFEQKGTDPVHGGTLLVDNAGHNSGFATMPEASYKFIKIEAKRYGHIEFVGQSSILEISSGAGLEGDNTKPQIKISGTLNYTGTDRLMVDGVDLGLNGKTMGINDVTVGQTLSSGMTLYGHTWYHNSTVPYHFGDMLVTSLGTVTLVSQGDHGVYLELDGLTVNQGGLITGDGTGYSSVADADSVYEPEALGQGGTGGSIKLTVAGTTTLNGSITSLGACNSSRGGKIWINTETLSGTGSISASASCSPWNSFGGTGGRIALYYTTNTNFALDGEHLQAYGGRWQGRWDPNATDGWGAPGTAYVEHRGVDSVHGGTLIVDNAGHNAGFASIPEGSYKFTQIKVTRYGHVEFVGQNNVLEISSGAGMLGDNTKPQIKISGTLNYTGTDRLMVDGVDLGLNGKTMGINDVTVGQTLTSGMTLYGHTWYHNSTVPYRFNDLLVTSLGTVTLVSQGDHGVYLELGNLTVDQGGLITGDGTGYSSVADADSVYEPEALGQGGTGGSIKLTVSEATTINGSLTSNGACNSSRGGKIWLNTSTLSGTGIISVSGTCSPWNSFGGTGGRIAVYYDTNTNFVLDGAHLQSYGGRWVGRWDWNATDGWGAPGTAYVEHKGADPVHGGTLIVDNAGHNAGFATVPEASYKFTQVRVSRYGHVDFAGQNNVLEIASATSLVGDSTKPQIKISGTLNYTGSERLIIDGIDLGLNGKAMGVQDITVGQTTASGLTLYGHTWYHNKTVPYHFGDMLVTALGTVSLVSQNEQGVYVELSNLTVDEGGFVSGDGTGYASTAGVESIYEPESLGQGGAGGSIKLMVSGTTTINGRLSSDGACNAAKGGAIWLDTSTIAGNGVISTSGTCSPWYWGGGGGGRIALYYNTNSGFHIDTDHLLSLGGRYAGRWNWYETVGWGNPGTVYVENKTLYEPHQGDLTIDNWGRGGTGQEFTSGIYNFNNVTIGQNVTIWIKSDPTKLVDALSSTAPHALAPTSSTVLSYNFDDTTATSFSDASGNGHVATAGKKNTIAVAGKFGNGQKIGQADLGLTFTDIPMDGNWSIDMWVKFPLPTTLDGWNTLIHQNGAYHDIIVHPNGQMGAYYGGFYDSGFSVLGLTSGWHHIAVVASGSTTLYYADGHQVGSIPVVIHNPINVLGNAVTDQQAGGIDEVRVQNKAMTSSEVLAAAEATQAPVANANTVALWHLDEDNYSRMDSSVNPLMAQEIGPVTTVAGKFGSGRSVAVGQVIKTERITLGSDWTIDMWASFPLTSGNPSGGWRTLASRSDGGSYPIMIHANGNIGYHSGTAWYDTGYNINSLSGWHHVAAIGSGTSTKFYIDGQYVATSPAKETGTINAFGNIEVSGAPYPSGAIDEVRVRNRAVSDAEILEDADANVAPTADSSTLLLMHFNAPAAKTIADASTNGLAGTLFGTAASGGEYGSSRFFTGLRDYVQVPSSTMDFTGGMTISLWAKPTANSNQARFVDFGNGCPSDNIIFYREGTSNNLIFIVYRGGSYSSYVRASDAIINNEWHQYVATMDASGNAKIYRDGVVVGSGTVNVPNTVERTVNYIGKSCSGSEALYTGYMDDLHIYSQGFSEDQARASAKGFTDAEYTSFQSKLVGQGVRFELTGDFTLASGASILGTGVGFTSDNGAGRGGRGLGYSGGAGGANGGSGGQGQSDGSHQPATGGVKFGDQLLPITLGAGGGSSGVGALGGEGGGAFGVIARGKLNNEGQYTDGAINIAGTINMDGNVGKTGSPGGGGGAGGSILLHGNSCSITGNLSANGGAGGNSDIDGGSGGGGRISVLYNVGPCDVSGTVSVTEGTPADSGSYGAQVGQVGTYPPEPNSVPWPSQYREQFEVTETPTSSLEQGSRIASAVEASKSAVLGTSENIIPVGGIINGTTVTLKADAYDAGARPISPKHLRIQVEIKKVADAFDGTTGLHNSNTIVFAGGAPVVLSVGISDLEMGTSYKWRVRTANIDTGLYSDWEEYGGNSSSVADFTITTVASLDLTLSKSAMELPDTASITVAAKSSSGAVDTSYRGTVIFSSSSSTADLPTSYTFTGGDAGTHTFSNVLKFYEAGTFSVTVEDTVNLALLDSANITVTVPPVPFITLGSSADLVTVGGQVTLTWQSNALTDLLIDNGVGTVGTSGSIQVAPPLGETTYTIQGRQGNGNLMTASVTITATTEFIPTTPAPTATATTTPTSTPPTVITGSATPTITITPSVTTSTTPKVTTTVKPRPTPAVVSCPIITVFTVSNRIVKKGDAITVSWQVQNADKVSIDSFSGSLSNSGSASVILNKTQDVTLYASKGTCKRTQKNHVEVVNSYPWEGAGGMLIGLFALETVGLQIGVTQGNIWFALLGLIDRSKKRKPWGVVYNSVTKALLSRVVVRLWDAVTGKLVDTVVTDANGIFKLTPKKGRYVVKVALAGFVFPSKLINTDTDTGFTNIYTGEVIEISDNNEILMISIPIDPVKKQKAAFGFQQVMNFLEELVGVISPIILIAGFAYSIVVTMMYPLSINYIILGMYALTFVVKAYVYLSRPKLFGMVTGVDGKVISGLEIGLVDKEFKNLISRTFTNKQGAYNFVVKNQEYYLQVMDPGYKLLSREVSKDGLLIKKSGGNTSVKLVTENLIVYPVQNLVKSK